MTFDIYGDSTPGGSKDPNNRASGPKYHNMNGLGRKPHYLGPWTLRDRETVGTKDPTCP